MKIKKNSLGLLFLIVALVVVPGASANPTYFAALQSVYGPTTICLTCHTSTDGPPPFTAYGSLFSANASHFTKPTAVLIAIGPPPTSTATPTPTPTRTPTPTQAGVFDQNTPITTTHGNITAAQIAEIQPGLGTVMREYAYRFWAMYYSAKSGNWDLAQYQLKEAREIQEVGEITRPGRAPMLKAFEASYLDPLQDTMNATNWTAFQTQYNITAGGCNGCHAANGFSYIKYTLPSHPPNLLFAPGGSGTIGVSPTATATATPVSTAKTPGFGAIIAVFAIAMIASLLKKNRNRR